VLWRPLLPLLLGALMPTLGFIDLTRQVRFQYVSKNPSRAEPELDGNVDFE
jgi:hypothetical protein